MSKTMKNTMVLTIITLIAGLALGFVYEITKDPIAQAQDAAKKEAVCVSRGYLEYDHFYPSLFSPI